MPAVSRERVSSLLNFIVQLASHIWVLESLGGFGGRGALAPAAAVELEAAPPTLGPVSGVGWGALSHREGARGRATLPRLWGHPSDSGLQEERQELRAGGAGAVSGYSSIKT